MLSLNLARSGELLLVFKNFSSESCLCEGCSAWLWWAKYFSSVILKARCLRRCGDRRGSKQRLSPRLKYKHIFVKSILGTTPLLFLQINIHHKQNHRVAPYLEGLMLTLLTSNSVDKYSILFQHLFRWYYRQWHILAVGEWRLSNGWPIFSHFTIYSTFTLELFQNAKQQLPACVTRSEKAPWPLFLGAICVTCHFEFSKKNIINIGSNESDVFVSVCTSGRFSNLATLLATLSSFWDNIWETEEVWYFGASWKQLFKGCSTLGLFLFERWSWRLQL